jgi:hypothetical protein
MENEVKMEDVAKEKPQIHFTDTIDNSHNPFVPKLKQKTNALVPYGDYLSDYLFAN